jgi:hypothetical protein
MSNEWFWALQYADSFPTEREADEAVLALAKQEGFLAGRSTAGGKVQAFFQDTSGGGQLPDNMRRVMLRPSMIESWGR